LFSSSPTGIYISQFHDDSPFDIHPLGLIQEYRYIFFAHPFLFLVSRSFAITEHFTEWAVDRH